MTWDGDACGLVDEFRSGQLHPAEVMSETLSEIASSTLNAFSFIDEEGALTAAGNADVQAPFGAGTHRIPTAHRRIETFAAEAFVG